MVQLVSMMLTIGSLRRTPLHIVGLVPLPPIPVIAACELWCAENTASCSSSSMT